MNSIVVLMRSVQLALVIPLVGNVGCVTSSKQVETTVRPQCSIAWDKADDPEVTGYQLTILDQSKQSTPSVRFIAAETTLVSCVDAGASHEGMWDVTVQSCYDRSTCGPPTDVAHLHIMTK